MFDAIFTPRSLLEQVSDRAWLQAMLDFERALAAAEAELGLIPASAAEAIAAACRAELFDPDRIAAEGRASGNPAEPLVRALRNAVGGDAAGYVHHGATSQDVVDTAAMLVAARALATVLADVASVTATCAELADAHRETPMVARTLLQHAVPTTFGLKAAGWLAGVLEAQELVRAAADRLAVQLGGAAGTLAALGDHGPAVAAVVAGDLGLAEPALPWHTSRVRVAALGSALATLAGSLGKIALDVVLMAQTEVGEVAEPAGQGRGGSSTMPHKQNPVGSILALACARRAQASAGLLTGGLVQEHERAAGAWQAEWDGVSGALAAAGGAAASMAEVLLGLRVDRSRMAANLALTRGLILSERLVFALAERVGQADAKQLVSAAAARAALRGTTLREELEASEDVLLTAAEIAVAFVPETYLGAADVFIDRALDLYRESGGSLA
ncbi:MAG: 3-carboxy-cis,cis-muconate cycloisomerase [Gaiellales bacterium]|jgi:3-carboxy-cis,cis-muconate cycloisomerase|nr:3-carboxy-cis,cis-muconate cycloisomerase [Gaiellales bacterium]